jgi:hypothetical protein
MGNAQDDEQELIAQYFAYWSTEDDSLFGAYQQVDRTVRKDAERGWQIVTALVRSAPNDAALSYVADPRPDPGSNIRE